MQPKKGFLLTRHSYDINGNAQIVLWLATDEGPARLIINDESAVLFVESCSSHEATSVLLDHYIKHKSKSIRLKTFNEEPVDAFYFRSLKDFYAAGRVLKENKITTYEDNIRLVDRYLMERFVRGGIEFIGNANQQNGFIEYTNVKIKPCDYKPQLTVVSLDIECSVSNELYSIGLYAQQANRLIRKVIMIAE